MYSETSVNIFIGTKKKKHTISMLDQKNTHVIPKVAPTKAALNRVLTVLCTMYWYNQTILVL